MSRWFASNHGLAVQIENWAADWGFFWWIFIPVWLFFGALAAVAAESVVVVAFGLLSRWVSWAPCPHGIPRGKTQDRCEKCVRDEKEVEDNRRRERELEERQRRIDDERRRINLAADNLRDGERLRLAKSLVPNIEELRRLSWQQFEDEVALMFERLGFAVKQTPYVNDGGRDLILSKDGKKYLGECKKYAECNVSGRPDLQKFHSAMITDGAVSGFFVTAGGFTKEAMDFAALVQIELIDQDKLVRMMFDSKPDPVEDDSYRSMCPQCEDIVSHRLRTPQSTRCRNGHDVSPALPNFESLLPVSARPLKNRRGRRSLRKLKEWRGVDPATAFALLDKVDQQQAAHAAIVGNTYPVKDQLKALGGRWNPDQKAWMVPASKAVEAKALVDGVPAPAAGTLTYEDRGENDTISSSYGAISYQDKLWSLRYRGERYPFTRADDGSLLSSLDVIILRSAPYKSKSYYRQNHAERDDRTRPVCTALNGVTPDADAMQKQAVACGLCPRNEWKTNAEGHKERECSDYRRVSVLILPILTKGMLAAPLMEPVLLRVPEASLDDLIRLSPDANMYGKTVPGQPWGFVTRISFHENLANTKMVLRPLQALTDSEVKVVLPMRDALLTLKITGEDQDLSSDSGVQPCARQLDGTIEQGIRSGDGIMVRYLDDNKTAAYTLSDARNDLAPGVLSVTSPLGKQVLGLVEGDETEFEVAGRVRRILIVRVERQASPSH